MKRQNDQKIEFSHSVNSAQPEALSSDEPNDGDKQPEVVRRTVRLESEVDSEIERLCSTSKIHKSWKRFSLLPKLATSSEKPQVNGES
jgi:hypothetical protein